MSRPKTFTFTPLYLVVGIFLFGYISFYYVKYQIDIYIAERLYQEKIVEVRLLDNDRVELVHVNGRVDRYPGTDFNRHRGPYPILSGRCYSKPKGECTSNK